MKKMYKQPTVETEQLTATNMVLSGSGSGPGIPTSNEPGQGIEGD